MTDQELNKLLHEKVMNECWHEPENSVSGSLWCRKCNYEWLPKLLYSGNPSYTTNPADYWRLLQNVKMHKDAGRFLARLGFAHGNREVVDALYTLLDMPRGCQAIADFFVLKDGEE